MRVPPPYAKDYRAQFAALDKVFYWPEPTFAELDEDGQEQIIDQARDRPCWGVGPARQTAEAA